MSDDATRPPLGYTSTVLFSLIDELTAPYAEPPSRDDSTMALGLCKQLTEFLQQQLAAPAPEAEPSPKPPVKLSPVPRPTHLAATSMLPSKATANYFTVQPTMTMTSSSVASTATLSPLPHSKSMVSFGDTPIFEETELLQTSEISPARTERSGSKFRSKLC